MPGRKWYAIAAAIFLVGMAGTALFLFFRLSRLGDELLQVVVPRQAEMILEKPGTYTIFHEYESVVDGQYYSSPGPISGLKVEVTSSATGAQVPLRIPAARTTYSVGGRSGVSIFSFEIGTPGPYRLLAAYPDDRQEPPVVLAVGHGFGMKLFTMILGGLTIAFGSFAGAGAIAVVTFVRRRKIRRASAAP